jgi:hypothetical protein
MLPAWDEITTSKSWQTLSPEEKHNIFNSYLNDLNQQGYLKNLTEPEKNNVINAMKRDAGFDVEKIKEEPSLVSKVVKPFEAIGLKAIGSLYGGTGAIMQDIAGAGRFIEKQMDKYTEGTPLFETTKSKTPEVTDFITNLAKHYAKNAEYYNKKAKETGSLNAINELLGGLLGGAVPGVVEFEAGPFYAAAVGASEASQKGESPVTGAAKGGLRRILLGKILGSAGVLKRLQRAMTMGATFGAEAKARGASKEEVMKATGTGFLLGLTGGKGEYSFSDLIREKGILAREKAIIKALKGTEELPTKAKEEAIPEESIKLTDVVEEPAKPSSELETKRSL